MTTKELRQLNIPEELKETALNELFDADLDFHSATVHMNRVATKIEDLL